jgi:hypothetical protein
MMLWMIVLSVIQVEKRAETMSLLDEECIPTVIQPCMLNTTVNGYWGHPIVDTLILLFVVTVDVLKLVILLLDILEL